MFNFRRRSTASQHINESSRPKQRKVEPNMWGLNCHDWLRTPAMPLFSLPSPDARKIPWRQGFTQPLDWDISILIISKPDRIPTQSHFNYDCISTMAIVFPRTP
jgi:hypothetical protein